MRDEERRETTTPKGSRAATGGNLSMAGAYDPVKRGCTDIHALFRHESLQYTFTRLAVVNSHPHRGHIFSIWGFFAAIDSLIAVYQRLYTHYTPLTTILSILEMAETVNGLERHIGHNPVRDISGL